MLYDSKYNCGWLVVGMKNFRRKKAVKKAKSGTGEGVDATDGNSYSDFDAERDVNLLKSTKVDENNMAMIKEKIKFTHSYRQNMFKDLTIDLLESFPYFFTHPKLVSV